MGESGGFWPMHTLWGFLPPTSSTTHLFYHPALLPPTSSTTHLFPPRNVIYCIRCTACNQLYIGETGRRLGDRFREYILDVKNNSQDVSKPVARHFNQPGHSHNNMKIFGLSLHQGNTESRKCTEQRLIFKIGTLSPAGINERFSFS